MSKNREIIFHFNKKHLEDSTIPMWVIKYMGQTHYINHLNVDKGVGFSSKETPDNPHTFNNIMIFINKDIMNKELRFKKFIEEARKVHGDSYDYSLVNYVNVDTNIKIICKIHGEFNQTPYTHKTGSGCSKCRSENLSIRYRDSLDLFIRKAISIHGNIYDYSNVVYLNQMTKISIICSKHGEFKQIPNSHLQGRGCPICKESKGEKTIRTFLEMNNIEFIPQYKFDNCVNIKTKRKLPFDFYLPNYKMCIEYDGKQHFGYEHGGFGASLENTIINHNNLLINDNIKNKYCFDNKIELLRISYLDDIQEKMNSRCFKIQRKIGNKT